MKRFIVVPLRIADDLPLARYNVQAAHDSPGAIVVLDLTAVGFDLEVRLEDLVAELARTTAGNGQSLAVLGAAGVVGMGPSSSGAACEVTWHGDLESCLSSFAAPVGKTFEVELGLPARMEYLAPVRRYLAGAVRRLHGDTDAFHVEILVDELCLNAVENSPSNRISYEVSFRVRGVALQVEVTNLFDDSVNSERIMHRRLKSFDDSGDYLGERGRGLFLIARIADGLQIRSIDADRIQVTVHKRLGRVDAQPPLAEERVSGRSSVR